MPKPSRPLLSALVGLRCSYKAEVEICTPRYWFATSGVELATPGVENELGCPVHCGNAGYDRHLPHESTSLLSLNSPPSFPPSLPSLPPLRSRPLLLPPWRNRMQTHVMINAKCDALGALSRPQLWEACAADRCAA